MQPKGKKRTHIHPPQTGSKENGGECEREGRRVSECSFTSGTETAARGDCRGVTLGGESVDALCGFKLRD